MVIVKLCHWLLNNLFKVGMFKIHPPVPECMSNQAKGFIMTCFVPNPDNRATAAELLMDTFLRGSPKKKAKCHQEAEPKDILSTGEDIVSLFFLIDLMRLVRFHQPFI